MRASVCQDFASGEQAKIQLKMSFQGATSLQLIWGWSNEPARQLEVFERFKEAARSAAPPCLLRIRGVSA
jgi:hypothetical protein